MIVVLLLLIACILLFGAGVVKGWLTNIVGYGVGGTIVLLLALKLGSYMGEYGPLWVIAILAAVFGLAVLVEDYVRKRELAKLLDRQKPASRDQILCGEDEQARLLRSLREKAQRRR